ncbi:UNVERIFIED_CONTAM: Methyltransferase-like protein 24 [Gekko kuhli]
MANSGCEVHRFDPSIRSAHIQEGHLWYHRLSIDWRDPNPAIAAHKLHANTKKLGTVLNDFGHHKRHLATVGGHRTQALRTAALNLKCIPYYFMFMSCEPVKNHADGK